MTRANDPGMKPAIVHISADYPDACAPQKTRAVKALIDGTADRFEHRVYSLNRHGAGLAAFLAPGSVSEVADDGHIAAWRYAAPAKGILLRRAMERIADRIVDEIRARGLRPRLIQGHKLSIEGIAARRVAAVLGVPYALTLQGNTDQKVMAARPDLRALHRDVWRDAAAVFAFAPWISRWCEARLGPSNATQIALPCIPVTDRVIAPCQTGPHVITAFHLDHWRNKNIVGLARACVSLRGEFPDLSLEIAGSGTPDSELAVDRILEATGASAFSSRTGTIGENSIQAWMNQGAVFAMPSKRESFGMVFAEALLAGCPIVYPRGAAVDGYFDGASFAIGVDARAPDRIAAGLRELLRGNAARKRDLALWQQDSADEFRGPAILAHYADALTKALT